MNMPARLLTTEGSEKPRHGRVLVVAADADTSSELSRLISDYGYEVNITDSGGAAVLLLEKYNFEMIFVESQLPDITGCELMKAIKALSTESYVPVIFIVSEASDELLSEFMSEGGDDFLLKPFTPFTINARIIAMDQMRELRRLYKSSQYEQVVAKQILSAALSSRNTELDGMRVLTRSAAIFSGDLVLSARSPEGAYHIMLADFTGHGLSAAIGVLPVADMFSVMTEKGFEAGFILESINKKLHTLLPTGMFMAATMLQMDSDLKRARVWNGGMPDVYLIDQHSGSIKKRIHSRHVPLGINENVYSDFKFESVEILPGDHFIIYTDGLTDAVNSQGEMFGVERLEKLIGGSGHPDNVFSTIVDAFNHFSVDRQPQDDVTLLNIPCIKDLLQTSSHIVAMNLQLVRNADREWKWMIELSGSSLRDIDPVPVVMKQFRDLNSEMGREGDLQTVLAELYDNALKHGVLELGRFEFVSEDNRENVHSRRVNTLEDNFIRIELQQVRQNEKTSIMVCIEDSGNGFDHAGLMSVVDELSEEHCVERGGIAKVHTLCDSLSYLGSGNRVVATISSECAAD